MLSDTGTDWVKPLKAAAVPSQSYGVYRYTRYAQILAVSRQLTASVFPFVLL